MAKIYIEQVIKDFIRERFKMEATLVSGGQSGGDPFGGYDTWNELSLANGPFELQLVYRVGELAGVIDDWRVTASGVPDEHVEGLVAACDPWKQDYYRVNPSVRLEITINGVKR